MYYRKQIFSYASKKNWDIQPVDRFIDKRRFIGHHIRPVGSFSYEDPIVGAYDASQELFLAVYKPEMRRLDILLHDHDPIDHAGADEPVYGARIEETIRFYAQDTTPPDLNPADTFLLAEPITSSLYHDALDAEGIRLSSTQPIEESIDGLLQIFSRMSENLGTTLHRIESSGRELYR